MMRTGLLGLLCSFVALGCANVSPDVATTQQCEHDGPLVIDVRSDEEFAQGHVQDAIHIPHTEIADEIEKHAECKQCQVLLYCERGGRAGKAKKTLVGLGYTNVENLGGLEDARKRLE